MFSNFYHLNVSRGKSENNFTKKKAKNYSQLSNRKGEKEKNTFRDEVWLCNEKKEREKSGIKYSDSKEKPLI